MKQAEEVLSALASALTSPIVEVLKMAKRSLPTPEQLRELLTYDPETGKLYWKPRPVNMFPQERYQKSWNTRYAGREGFTADINGYLYGAIFTVNTYAHRVAWCIYYGAWPDFEIDHINCIKTDNRICNLRAASRVENSYNRPVQAGGSGGGLKGITRIKSTGNWQAQIRANGRYKYLGTYTTREAAHEAYKIASKALHGEFGRTE